MKLLLSLFVISVFLISGCVSQFNTATGRQETLLYGDDKEKSMGASIALQVEKEMKFDYSVDINERVDRIFQKIVNVCDRTDLVFIVRVIDDDELNAFSLPGGYVYINRGLVEKVDNDDQLAGVLGHEIAHITAKHALKRIQGAYGATALQLATAVSGQGALAAGIGLTASSILMKNSREDEFQADRLGVKYMRLAGYDPLQMKKMLAKLLEDQAKHSTQPLRYWRTHPYIPARMAQADAEAKGHAEYRDYLNMTGAE